VSSTRIERTSRTRCGSTPKPSRIWERPARVAASCPSTLTVPALGANRVVSTFIKVDLPAPFGPSKPVTFPPSEKVTDLSAARRP